MAKLTIYCDNELIDARLLADVVYKTLKQKINLSAEICFCEAEEIRALNKEQRNKDSVTDVLSFPSTSVTAGEVIKKKNYPFDYDPESKSVFLGSIMICNSRAQEQAEEFGHSLKRELYYLAVHGLLHIFGYDHEIEEDKRVMRETEEIILERMGAVRV